MYDVLESAGLGEAPPCFVPEAGGFGFEAGVSGVSLGIFVKTFKVGAGGGAAELGFAMTLHGLTRVFVTAHAINERALDAF